MGADDRTAGVRPRAVVVEDTALRDLLHYELDELEVTGTYPTIEALLQEAPPADVVVLDHHLAVDAPVLQGPEGVRALIAAGYKRICLYTQESRPLPLVLCLVAGALGLARKSDPITDSQDQFLRVARGEAVIADSFPAVAEFLARRSTVRDLTDKQRVVLHGRARGLSWHAIARQLGGVHEKTAEEHLASINAKIGRYLHELGRGAATTPADLERELGITPDDMMD